MSDLTDRFEGTTVTQNDQTEPPKASDPKLKRYLIIGLGGLGGLIVLTFIIAILVGATSNEGLASGFRIARDFLIIVLALQGIFISIALIALIIQLAALINLLQNEIKPVLDELHETAVTARGTAQFVSKNVTQPVIKVTSTFFGIRSFLLELAGIRRNTIGRK